MNPRKFCLNKPQYHHFSMKLGREKNLVNFNGTENQTFRPKECQKSYETVSRAGTKNTNSNISPLKLNTGVCLLISE